MFRAIFGSVEIGVDQFAGLNIDKSRGLDVESSNSIVPFPIDNYRSLGFEESLRS